MYRPWLDGFPGLAGAGASCRGTLARLEPGSGIAGQRIVVKPFKGMGPKVVGTYVSSDAGHLVVRRGNGQDVSIPKDHIRVVVRKRRIPLRPAVVIGAVAGFILCASWTLGEGDFDQPRAALFFGGAGTGLGALGGLAAQAIGLGIRPVVYQAEKQDRRASKTR